MGLMSIGKRKNRKLLFIGPPRSGKTVFFSTMIDRLGRLTHDPSSGIECVAKGRHSEKFVRSVIKSLRKQVWPKEGGAVEADETFTYSLTHKGRFYDTKYLLSCRDYAGETFNAAFGNPDTVDSDADTEQVKQLKSEVEEADIVFLIADAVRLHGGDCAEMEDSLFGVAEVLQQQGTCTAFVLTQKDEFEEYFSAEDRAEIIESLVDEYSGLYAMLKEMKTEFFWVSSVVATTDSDGRRVPPVKYKSKEHSIDLLAPINWAFSLPDQG